MGLQRILLETIATDDFFRLSFPLRPDLYAGIERRFPQWPLLAVDRENRIVCGHDYVSLLKRRRQMECRGLRIDLDEGNGLLLNFSVKQSLTGLNLFEQVMFVRKALPFFPAREIQRRAALSFAVEELLPKMLDALLSPPFGRLLASNRISLKSARRLLDLPEGDRAALLQVLAAAAFTENQQLRLIELAEETAFARREPALRVLSRAGIPRLVKQEMPQKRILESLFRLRYPHFSESEDRWLEKIGEFTRDGRVQVRRHPFGEKKDVEVVIRVGDGEKALKMLENIKKTLAEG
jgi:hypothetical protein